jgi:hypothetical protein
VHFAGFDGSGVKGNPSKPPAKTHAVSEEKSAGGGEPAARADDAGYVLYETSQFFYLASHDHTRLKWRLAKIARRGDGLEVDEHALVYHREELKEVLSLLHRGNEASGGLRAVARGAGVVSIVELAAGGADDPASAWKSGPEAVIRRAENLHEARARVLAKRNEVPEKASRRLVSGGALEERAETPRAGGSFGHARTSSVVFSGVATQSVRRKGRVRARVAGVAKRSRENEMRAAIAALIGGSGRGEKDPTGASAVSSVRSDGETSPTASGKVPRRTEHDVGAALDPGESATIGSVRVHRLTIGHASSQEPERRLGLGRANAALRARESRRFEEAAAARAAEDASRRRAPSCVSRSGKRAARDCSEGISSAFFNLFGNDALEEEEAFFEKRNRILRDRERPTVDELRDARLHDVHMKLSEQPEEIVEDGPWTALADWFGNDWWLWNDDDAEDAEYRIDPSRPLDQAMHRKRDPLVVKLRFRQYAEHADAGE